MKNQKGNGGLALWQLFLVLLFAKLMQPTIFSWWVVTAPLWGVVVLAIIAILFTSIWRNHDKH